MDRACDARKQTVAVVHTEAVVSSYAHSSLRGWRVSMEDAVVAELLGPQLGCFSVLDGHGGQFCARWAAAELVPRLRPLVDHVFRAADDDEARGVAQHLSAAVRRMDADLRSEGKPAWACGTTLVTLIVTSRSLTVANLGDSRAVLCRSGGAVPLSRDHKPRNADERQRIIDAGGFIADGRVNGDLSLSRALGDFRHKVVHDLPPSKQPVSSEPEVRTTARLRTDNFVLLACDGLWDVMSTHDAVVFIAGFLERAPAGVTAASVDESEARRSSLARLTEVRAPPTPSTHHMWEWPRAPLPNPRPRPAPRTAHQPLPARPTALARRVPCSRLD